MLQIETCTPDQPRWGELTTLADELGQKDWFAASFEWHLGAHVLAAR